MTKPIALTFEAGGDPTICNQMLNVLSIMQTTATIFLAGNWSEQYPELVRRMSAEGHEFGNHSYSHPDLTQCDDQQVREELRRTDAIITQLTGQRAFPWFRPPYDAIDERIRQIALDEGYQLVQRSALDGGHWPGETTPELVQSRSLENAFEGAVLTYHLDSPNTLVVLPHVLESLRAADFEFARLSQLPSVSERPERCADFANLEINPGYLQVLKRLSRAWSMNVVEFGARANAPIDIPLPIVATGSSSLSLLTSKGVTEWQPASKSDRYLLVMAGAPECSFRTCDDTTVRVRAVGSPGDLILWSAGYEFRTGLSQQSWIMLIFE
jgi:peptidoglycan/xylan/chitin deacetylase (PgdA/CDA1 family)